MQFRAEAVVPVHMAEMTRCVKERDFQGFGQLTMKDSNQLHATCLDTFPPICYLNDTSRRIIQLVHRFNAHHGRTKARRGWETRHPRQLQNVWALLRREPRKSQPALRRPLRTCLPPRLQGVRGYVLLLFRSVSWPILWRCDPPGRVLVWRPLAWP